MGCENFLKEDNSFNKNMQFSIKLKNFKTSTTMHNNLIIMNDCKIL